MLKGENIICIAGEGWGALWRRRHALMTRFAKRNRVLFIAPPLSILTSFRNFSKGEWKDLLGSRQVRQMAENLFMYQCWNVLPFARFRIIRRINKLILERNLKKIAKKLKFKNPILWITINKEFSTYIGLFKEKLVCYDCQDRWATSDGGLRTKAYRSAIESWENYVLKTADVVFTVSEEIAHDLIKINKNVHCVPNGVDYDLFSRAMDENIETPNDLKLIKKPIIAYVGGLQYKVDFELLASMAGSMPGVSIVLIGPKDINNPSDEKLINNLASFKNVYFFGRKPREQLPAYLKAVDVCLMPLKQVDLNWYGCPNKLLEYAAAGKPIVAMDQGRSYAYEEIMKIAHSKNEFIELVHSALRETQDTDIIKRRQAIARENSWDKRSEAIMRILAMQLKKKCVDEKG
jgi:glycosyltransferase involved in cell wall biosynthesis